MDNDIFPGYEFTLLSWIQYQNYCCHSIILTTFKLLNFQKESLYYFLIFNTIL